MPALLLLHCGIVLAYDQGLDEEREPVCTRSPRSVCSALVAPAVP